MKQTLRQRGVTLTPQRMIILDVLEGNHGHLSAEEIFEEARKRYPYMNISTVYRTLELLKSLDLVAVTDLGGGCLRYHQAKDAGHHHLVCHECGKTFELEDEVLEPVRASIRDRYRFEAQMHHFAIWGTCAACREKEGGH